MSDFTANDPPPGTVEFWAHQLVSTTSLAHKLNPGAPPADWAPSPQVWAPVAPGRPIELTIRSERKKPVRPGSLHHPKKFAEVLHTFLHHELQAAELMAWAILAFPQTPPAFRRGLLGICLDEIRHLQSYAAHLQTLGFPFGTFPIKDWFWQRVPMGDISPAHFVARLGIGFEGGNLDHGARFADYFAAAGDAHAATMQRQIVTDEVSHAAFALHWFAVFTGELSFETWRTFLPSPITPNMTRGLPLNMEARKQAGYPPAFLESLRTWNLK